MRGCGARAIVLFAIAVIAIVAVTDWTIHRIVSSIPSTCVQSWGSRGQPARPIVAFGDSITYGEGASRNCVGDTPSGNAVEDHIPGDADTTYPADTSRQLGQAVLDYGNPGETTGAGSQRLEQVLRETNAGTVLLLEGVNDYLSAGTAPLITLANLQDMVQAAQSAHARVILLTLTPVSADFARAHPGVQRTIDEINRGIRALARHRDLRLLDVGTTFSHEGVASLVADGVHPNDLGYEVIGSEVAAALRER